MITEYAILKQHFDRIISCGFSGNGLESIRDVYEHMFNKRINLYDVYQTNFRFQANPIGNIITLVGPDQNDENYLPEGFIPCNKTVSFVNIVSDSILKGVREEDAEWYTNFVYTSIDTVISKDSFYGNDREARCNPHVAFLRLAPLYFTYHHLASCAPSAINYDVFKNIIEKYITTGDNIDRIFSRMHNDRYSTEEEVIYYTMTDHNTIECIF